MNDKVTNKRPLVTFVIFAYNQEHYIREAVEGAFAQTYEPLEIILSDDCSTDLTFRVMAEMTAAYKGPHEVRVRQNEVNLGLACHINSFLVEAKGEFVCWAAGDDISMPERTSILILPMLKNPHVIGTHSTVQEIDISGNLGKIRQHSKNVVNLSAESIVSTGLGVVSQAHAFRMKVFDTFGPLHRSLTNEGPAMAFRECLLGKVAYITEPTVYYRIGSGVSTYQGGNVIKTKTYEPIKVCNWRLSSFEQMLDDCKKAPYLVDEIKVARLENKVLFYKNLLDINNKKRVFRSLFKNFILSPSDTRSLRAMVRVFFPISIYKRIKS